MATPTPGSIRPYALSSTSSRRIQWKALPRVTRRKRPSRSEISSAGRQSQRTLAMPARTLTPRLRDHLRADVDAYRLLEVGVQGPGELARAAAEVEQAPPAVQAEDRAEAVE